MLCERLSRRRVELGIVPIGSLGLSLFGFDLYAQVPAILDADPVGWLTFLGSAHGLRIAVDLIGIGVFGGFFIVPLYAFVQQETPPEQRARVIAANNILNALVLLGAVRRPIRFVMDSRIFNSPVLSVVFRLVRAIPIAPRSKDPAVYEAAFEAVSRELRAGQLVCIFPEGKLTTGGEIDSFRTGIETIVQRDPVPVVPMALQGLWGSFFSHKDGPALSCPPRRFWSRIGLVAGTPWPAEKVTAAGLEAEVRRLRGDAR